METEEAAEAGDYIKALSQLLAVCLAEMASDGRKAGAFDGMDDDELHCYIASLCIRGGLNTLNEKRPEGRVLEVCHAIMQTAVIELSDEDTIH